MKRVLCGCSLLFAILALGQQQSRPPYNTPPYNAPPSAPEDQNPPHRMPPDTAAPAARPLTPAEAQEQIQKKLDTEPALSAAAVKATVDDSSVVLTGTVNDEREHAMALRIAESYAGERQILDQIEVRQRT